MADDWTVTFHLDQLADELRARLPAATRKGAEQLRTVITPLVPKETGDLAGSGEVRPAGDDAELYYSGPYALYQENGVYYRHGVTGAPLSHTTGQSFFMASGVVVGKNSVIQVIRDELFK